MMTSKIPVTINRKKNNRSTTDLDAINEEINDKLKHDEKKQIKTLCANFTSKRSRSQEGFNITNKRNVRQLLEIKDEQIEKLVDKLTSLIEYNRQFAKENDRLVEERVKLMDNVEVLNKRIQIFEQDGCQECTNLREAAASSRQSFEKCSKENIDLLNDVKMLKVLVYRLNIQIERYQEFYRKYKGNGNKLDEEMFGIDFNKYGEPPPEYVWGDIRSGVLAPLLNAYEEMIKEKSDVIGQFEKEMSDFTGRLKTVMKENETLWKNIEETKQETEVWIQERERLQVALDLYKNKADVQGKRADLGKEKLVEVIRVYEQKVQSQCLDIERLQEAYSRCKGELTGLKHLSERPESVVESLKECQKLFEELKSNHDTEKIKLTEDISKLNQKHEESHEKLQILTDENKKLKLSLEKEKEAHIVLAEKYAGLKTNIHRIRQSNEMLRNRLKAVIAWGKGLEDGKDKLQSNWNDVHQVQALLTEKQSQIQAMHAKHLTEIDELQRKLKHREETLRKVLKDKTERKSNASKQK